MTFRATAVLILLAALAAVSNAQVQYSVSNFLRYGNGTQSVAGFKQTKEYIENQADVRFFWSDFTVGFRYLHDNPPEFGPDTTGLRKRYVEFSHQGIELLVGDYYTLYGKGLAMNLFENRGINYDTGLEGLRGIFRTDEIQAVIAAGKMRFFDLLNPRRIETYSVKSAHAEVAPWRFLRVGGSIVGVDGQLPSVFGVDEVRADIPEAMLNLRGYGFDVFASRSWKRATGIRPGAGGRLTPFKKNGEGTYGSISYASDIGFGATFEYKDYRFDEAEPLERTDANRPTRMLPMQNPPIVHKEHSFTLLSRTPHIIDFNDEIGMQLDLFYSVTPDITVNLNASTASRHKKYAMNSSGVLQVADSVQFLPSMDKEYSPFWEFYTDVEWYFEGQSSVRIGFNRRYDAPFEEFGNIAHVQSSTTIPVHFEYQFSEEYTLSGNLENQWFHDSFLTKKDVTNTYVALTLSRAPGMAATLRFEMSDDISEGTGEKLSGDLSYWVGGEFTYRIGSAHTATVFYGRERGGLVCSSGICRVVNPFNGIRFSLMSQI